MLELFWVLGALELAVPRSYPFVIEASTKVIAAASLFIPLQLGAAEGIYAVVFDTMGLPAAAGFVLAFARRARTLVVSGLGLIALAVLNRDTQ